jgi:hypothetical protein
MVTQFYQGLFTAQEDLDPELVCSHVPKKVTEAMNEYLDRVTTRLPEAGLAYAWQLARTPRISPQTNTCLSCALCPHSCAPGKDFPVGHPLLQVKHA